MYLYVPLPREREEARRAKEFRASKAKVLQVPPFVPRSVERYTMYYIVCVLYWNIYVLEVLGDTRPSF